MKSLYYLVILLFLLGSCSPAPSADAVQTAIAQTQIAQSTPTTIPTPTVSKPIISESCNNQLTRFLEEGTNLNAMTEQGVNYNNFQQQLASSKGAYDLAIATCPSNFAPEALGDLQKAFDGWELALYMWELKIGDKDNPTESSINGYAEIIDYGGEYLVYDVRDQNFIVEDYRGKKYLPFDENIGVLLSMAGDYFSSGQKQILAELP